MPRYAAFLRGVSPMKCKMPELKKCLENAGFTNVKTVLSSGNVVFDSKKTTEASLVKKIESAIKKDLGREFLTFVRSVDYLQEMIDNNPYSEFKLKAGSKRVVTFRRDKASIDLKLPIEQDGARILRLMKQELFSVYIPSPNNPAFMRLIEKSLGKDVTTRTWETVQKVARA